MFFEYRQFSSKKIAKLRRKSIISAYPRFSSIIFERNRRKKRGYAMIIDFLRGNNLRCFVIFVDVFRISSIIFERNRRKARRRDENRLSSKKLIIYDKRFSLKK